MFSYKPRKFSYKPRKLFYKPPQAFPLSIHPHQPYSQPFCFSRPPTSANPLSQSTSASPLSQSTSASPPQPVPSASPPLPVHFSQSPLPIFLEPLVLLVPLSQSASLAPLSQPAFLFPLSHQSLNLYHTLSAVQASPLAIRPGSSSKCPPLFHSNTVFPSAKCLVSLLAWRRTQSPTAAMRTLRTRSSLSPRLRYTASAHATRPSA